ncbi:MAG: type I restriction enzyme HsdR N-terminal domain-containing protein [Bacteroidota bacterium]
MGLIKRAIRDRYLTINKKRRTITYLPQGKERNLDFPEERVQAETYCDLIYRYGYPPEKLRVCEKVKIGSSTREADIIIYRDSQAKDPAIIVECKKRRISEKHFEGAIDQGFSYAAATRAEYVWATSGDRSAAFEVLPNSIHERARNRIRRIPRHDELVKAGKGLKKIGRRIFHPEITHDTLLYGVVLVLATLVLSKASVEFFPQIQRYGQPLWDKVGLNLLWIFNTIAALATLLSFSFGLIFMRSHSLFGNSAAKRKAVRLIIALILFIPVWYVGTSMQNPDWWNVEAFLKRKYPIVVFLWPYAISLPFQMAAIYGLMALMRRLD